MMSGSANHHLSGGQINADANLDRWFATSRLQLSRQQIWGNLQPALQPLPTYGAHESELRSWQKSE